MSKQSKVTLLKTKKPSKDPLKPPAHLKKASKELWKYAVETFDFEAHDLVLLESLCQTLDRKNLAETDLRKHGALTFKNRHGELRAHPAVAIIRDCNVLIARLRRELCLSEEEPPDSRPPKLTYGGPK